MSTQITIEDLRYIISQQYKPKAGTESQLSSLLKTANGLWNTSSKGYADWFYNTSMHVADESLRTSGIPRRKPLGYDELAYYDPSKKYVY